MTKKTTIILTLLLLTACGGGSVGDVQCNVAGACVVNVTVEAGAVQTGPITINTTAPAASAAGPAASSPVPYAGPLPQQKADVAFGSPYVKAPLVEDPGSFRWKSSGKIYMIRVGQVADVAYVILFSSVLSGDTPVAWQVEAQLDDALDLHAPGKTDAEIRVYLQQYVLPKLNAFLAERPSSIASPFTVPPVSSQPVPMDWNVFDRIAAFMPQALVWDLAGATPQIKLR